MQSASTKTGWRDRIRSRLDAVDAYFLSNEVRRRTANEIAYARVGLVGCFGLGAALCVLTAMLCFRTPWPIVSGIASAGAASLTLPFVLRRSDSIRSLGHVVCGQLLLLASVVFLASGGRGGGILPVIPIVPMVALLSLGGRAVFGWGLASVGVLGLGYGLAAGDATPVVAGFEGVPAIQR
ncbi:MAG: hypothetical protein IPK00_09905 [Deltaproteobacteria bacterium]|nr:hypothetical protein [Deltaproteobacteria bacterium]